eukprot:TRINITY_DN12629_c0_g1_i1.p2 TRINITY_DN12629_c0_g1~~TRINITY_DN12629_c0_g1_i1.p2  ORF type:complete len:127 (+),score=37.89 TRINITY_DN12629_c0_g1_i1:606-986(+)
MDFVWCKHLTWFKHLGAAAMYERESAVLKQRTALLEQENEQKMAMYDREIAVIKQRTAVLEQEHEQKMAVIKQETALLEQELAMLEQKSEQSSAEHEVPLLTRESLDPKAALDACEQVQRDEIVRH